MFYQKEKQRMRAKQTNPLGMKTNAVQPTPSQGSQRTYVFSTPSWNYPPSKHQWDKGRIKEDKGHWQQRGQESSL